MKRGLRALVRWTHVWLGLIGGLVICLMGFTGGLVALRPPLASLLSPAAPPVASCVASPDWDRAAKAASAITGTELNRVYGPVGSDTRYRFRMATEDPILFKHVIYDACSDRILGTINFSWMDWTVDLHHNLLSGKTGRRATGWMGLVMLISSLSGLGLWLLSRPNLRTAFLITPRLSARTPRELHRAIGILAAILLTVEAFTGLWLAFPQTMRGMLAVVVPIPTEARPPRPPKNATPGEPAGLTAWVTAARAALPDGSIREIRLPEGGGPVQVRMWRASRRFPRTRQQRGHSLRQYRQGSQCGSLWREGRRYEDRPGNGEFALRRVGWAGLPNHRRSVRPDDAGAICERLPALVAPQTPPRPRSKVRPAGRRACSGCLTRTPNRNG